MARTAELTMERTVELGVLLYYYGAFLTDRQREVLSLRVDDDYSLAEIAEREGISRQGVHDLLHRAQTLLYEMEERLKLAKRTAATEESLKRMERIIEAESVNETHKRRLMEETALVRSIWEEEYGV